MYMIYNSFKLHIHQYERVIASSELYYIWYHDIGYMFVKFQGDAVNHQKAFAARTPANL